MSYGFASGRKDGGIGPIKLFADHGGRSFSCFLLMMIAAAAATEMAAAARTPETRAARHEEWMARHGRVYKDDAEKHRRQKIFEENARMVENFNNNGNKRYKMALNKFGDMTDEELMNGERRGAQLHDHYHHLSSGNAPTVGNGHVPSPVTTNAKPVQGANNNAEPPMEVDWRTRGAVTSIKDQGTCSCCWAFATVAAVESMVQINKGRLMDLSPQELIDCDVDSTDHGCHGGFMTTAFNWIAKNGGLAGNDAYPFRMNNGTCQRNLASRPLATISGYAGVPANDEQALMKAVARQPVTIAFASGPTFDRYAGGIFDGPCADKISHAMLLVGYGEDKDGTKFWLVKNQYSEQWGENGYLRVLRGAGGDPRGVCQINSFPYYPIP